MSNEPPSISPLNVAVVPPVIAPLLILNVPSVTVGAVNILPVSKLTDKLEQ